MSNNEGIFEAVSGHQPVSPFAAVAPGAMASPFMAVEKSPFTVVDEPNGSRPVEPGKPARLPERRAKSDSPFQLAEDGGDVGFEAVAPVASPFQPVSAPSPFGLASSPAPQQAPQQQPFASPVYQAPAAFSGWAQPSAPAPAPQQTPYQAPQVAAAPFAGIQQQSVFAAPAPAPVAPQPVSQPVIPPPVQAPAPVAMSEAADSAGIRQIELRAIFGVDREMSHDEILQRARALPGIRHVARVDIQHMDALDSLRKLLAGLGFGTSGLRIYCGSSPMEFIREGSVILAAQTDGGFAPGVRETLMIVARELAK